MLKIWQKIYKRLKKSEKRFLYLVILLTLLISSIPLVFGLLSSNSELFYTGSGFVGGADKMVYFSQIEDARQGSFLLKNLYTSELQNTGLFSPLWFSLGFIAKLTGLPTIIIFHLARLVFGFILLFLLYLLLSKIFIKVKWRKIGFLILCFGSGLGIFTISSNWHYSYLYEHVGTDLWASEANTFLTISHSPLFILSQILILIIFWWTIERLVKSKLLEVIIMGLLVLLLGLIHPYDLFIIFSVIGTWFIIKSLKLKKFFSKIFLKIIILSLFGFMAGFYFFWLQLANPIFKEWLIQNVTLSPKIINYFIGYGLIFIFYIIAIRKTLKGKNKYLFFLSIWSVVSWFLLFLPVQFQRRMSNGLHMPMVIIAVVGLIVVIKFLNEKKLFKSFGYKSAFIQLILILLISSNIFFLGAEMVLILWKRYPIHIPRENFQAIKWFKVNIEKNEVILAAPATGNIIPAYSARTVYIGHGHQTANWLDKKNNVNNFFFSTNQADDLKERWLKQGGIDYLFFGHLEDLIGDFNPFEKNYLLPVWQEGKANIFKVIFNGENN